MTDGSRGNRYVALKIFLDLNSGKMDTGDAFYFPDWKAASVFFKSNQDAILTNQIMQDKLEGALEFESSKYVLKDPDSIQCARPENLNPDSFNSYGVVMRFNETLLMNLLIPFDARFEKPFYLTIYQRLGHTVRHEQAYVLMEQPILSIFHTYRDAYKQVEAHYRSYVHDWFVDLEEADQKVVFSAQGLYYKPDGPYETFILASIHRIDPSMPSFGLDKRPLNFFVAMEGTHAEKFMNWNPMPDQNLEDSEDTLELPSDFMDEIPSDGYLH